MRARLRRYPALGFLAVAALLASLLPSALRVPLSGPSSSAELAPVPGKSDNAQGDLSALGETSTGGLGSGGGSGAFGGGGRKSRPGAAPDTGQPPPLDNGSGRNPRQKRCVGKPPRQTEDPLSPPCVAFFKGDNGGATAKGVTAEEIVVVRRHVHCTDGETLYSDFDNSDPNDPNVDPVVAAYVRHFNERFQTYGRRVHLYGVRPSCGTSDEAFMADVDQRYRPFFVFSDDVNFTGRSFARAAADRGIVTILHGPKRETSLYRPPYVLSYEPDYDAAIASAAEFLCARLAGLTARFAGDPSYHGRTRKFGLVYDNDELDPTSEGAQWFLDHVRDRCGAAAGEVVIGFVGGVDGDAAVVQRDQDALARMRLAGVTTVVNMDTTLLFAIEADAAKWYPEWFVPGERWGGAGDNSVGNLNPVTQWRNAFGLTAMRRFGAPAEQPHVMPLREKCPDTCTISFLESYNNLLMLFWGIQAAGPRLTPANMDRGLHALPARRSLDPFTPAAYFAPGEYSFVKDWAAVWWDPTGRPPGTNDEVGCWRFVEDGLRYRVEDWQTRPGDDGIQGEGQPCQGETFARISERP